MGGPPPILRQPSPVYPATLTGVEGQAHVRFTITEDRRTTDVKAVSLEPEGAAFVEAAEQAMRRYPFEQPGASLQCASAQAGEKFCHSRCQPYNRHTIHCVAPT